MKFYKTKSGYYYKEYNNKKKKRISKEEFMKHTRSITKKHIMKGGITHNRFQEIKAEFSRNITNKYEDSNNSILAKVIEFVKDYKFNNKNEDFYIKKWRDFEVEKVIEAQVEEEIKVKNELDEEVLDNQNTFEKREKIIRNFIEYLKQKKTKNENLNENEVRSFIETNNILERINYSMNEYENIKSNIESRWKKYRVNIKSLFSDEEEPVEEDSEDEEESLEEDSEDENNEPSSSDSKDENNQSPEALQNRELQIGDVVQIFLDSFRGWTSFRVACIRGDKFYVYPSKITQDTTPNPLRLDKEGTEWRKTSIPKIGQEIEIFLSF